jgi:hypothetical protein
MSSQTQLYPPPTRSAAVDDKGFIAKPFRQWLFTVQNLLPLVTVNTAAGNVVIALPPAGLNNTTGESNQNSEIVYRKTSSDANTVTITGSPDGSQVLTSNVGAASRVRFKSDGTSWWVVG